MTKGSANRFIRGRHRLDRTDELRKAGEKSPQEIEFLLLAFCTKKHLPYGTITPIKFTHYLSPLLGTLCYLFGH
jgi:hypothetical protein